MVYYAGIFEVTEAQWAKVMGGSSMSMRTKGSVSYNAIRGDASVYDWPTSNEVAPDSETGLGDYAWYSANSGASTYEVGTRQPNAWGLYDVHGNVFEWCLNQYSSYSSYRVLRGGTYYSVASYCAFAYRNYDHPANGLNGSGFRLACRPGSN